MKLTGRVYRVNGYFDYFSWSYAATVPGFDGDLARTKGRTGLRAVTEPPACVSFLKSSGRENAPTAARWRPRLKRGRPGTSFPPAHPGAVDAENVFAMPAPRTMGRSGQGPQDIRRCKKRGHHNTHGKISIFLHRLTPGPTPKKRAAATHPLEQPSVAPWLLRSHDHSLTPTDTEILTLIKNTIKAETEQAGEALAAAPGGARAQ